MDRNQVINQSKENAFKEQVIKRLDSLLDKMNKLESKGCVCSCNKKPVKKKEG